jgi:hypothetical protein
MPRWTVQHGGWSLRILLWSRRQRQSHLHAVRLVGAVWYSQIELMAPVERADLPRKFWQLILLTPLVSGLSVLAIALFQVSP